ncbi:Elongation factor 1-beta [Trichinella britovi]|uniref:Elongation factor 1-beta n=1 Tax=Trichinella britovi TaxID=45882 RepID=A0A0V1CHJ6_TRIBR|nr:Elongation factor 1-beta [Trichinella britovi]
MFVTRWKFSTQDARLFDPSNYITATLTLKYFLSRSARFAPLESVAIAAEAKHLRCYQSPSAIYDIEGQKKELWRAFISLICSGSVSLIQIFIMVAKLPVEIDLKVLNASLETKSYINGLKIHQRLFLIFNDGFTILPVSQMQKEQNGQNVVVNLWPLLRGTTKILIYLVRQEKKRVRQERLDAYAAKKAKKPVAVAKSNIILDVKPWDDETDLKLMEESIRNITTDGLIWGPSKILPVAYGVKKLQIGCVVEDDKVGTDFLEENILALEDLVQSVDIVAFNKI